MRDSVFRLAAILAVAAAPATAQDAVTATGLSLSQNGVAAPVAYSKQTAPVSAGTVSLEPGAFEIGLTRGGCGSDGEGTYVRVHPADALADVLASVNDAALMPPADAILAIFQPGYGMAAEDGPVSTLYTDGSGAAPLEQAFNFFYENRFASTDGNNATIKVERIEAGGFDLLGTGTPVVLVVGRADCAGEQSLLLDVISVTYH